MRASKQLVTAPAVVSICIAVLWGICAIGVVAIYPTASQSTSAYRLADFSGNALTLINKLQRERAAVTAFLSTNESRAQAGRLKKIAQGTDRRHAVFRKSIGRFNSDDYGTELTSALKEANALLNGLSGLRTRVFDSAVSAEEAVEYYTKIVSKLAEPIFLLQEQPLAQGEADQSRKAYLRIVKALELVSRDMADGAVFLGGQQSSRKPDGSWRQISGDEDELLREYRSLASAEPRAMFDAWWASKARSAADAFRNELAQDSRSAIASGKHTVKKWIQVFHRSLMGLHAISLAQQRDFAKKVGGEAVRSAYLFVTLFLVASLATLVAVMCFKPVYFRHGLLALLVLGNLALIGWSIAIGPDWLIKESGPLESLQAFALAAAFLIFCADTVSTRDAPRVVAIIFTCACFLLFFREFDFRVYGAPEWLISISSGPGRRTWFVAVIAALIVYVATQRRYFREMVSPFLKWTAWPLLLWLPLLLTGELVEVVTHATQKDDLLGYWTNGQFWEELLELNAYLVLLFGAYVFGEIYGLRTREDSDARLRSLKCALAAKRQ